MFIILMPLTAQSKDFLLEPDMLLLQCWLAAAAAAGSSELQQQQQWQQGAVPTAVGTLLAALAGTPLMQAAGEGGGAWGRGGEGGRRGRRCGCVRSGVVWEGGGAGRDEISTDKGKCLHLTVRLIDCALKFTMQVRKC